MDDKKITGYSIYSEVAKRKTRINPLDNIYPKLPEQKYQIIYADPPWDYGGKLQYDKSSASVDEIKHDRNIFISSASFKYPTLKLHELMRLDVKSISDDNCLLFMWATSPHLKYAIQLGESWGFEYRTVAFVWDKMVHNPGKYTLSNTELCLVFKKGKIPSPRGARNIQQLVRSPRREHSQKPDEIRDFILKMFPKQSKIELFSRGVFDGWDIWGLDVLDRN